MTHGGDGRSALVRLRAGEPVFGLIQMMPGALVTELALWCGFDFVVLDCEHGVVDEMAHLASIQVISGSGAFSLVRVRTGDVGAVGRYLDLGADGIIMPNVSSREDALRFAAAAELAPRGSRSSTGGAMRAGRYGLGPARAAEAPILIAIVEGRSGVESAAAIAAVDGINGCLIGAFDLAADLGCSDFAQPAYDAAFSSVERAFLHSGRWLGCLPHGDYGVERLIRAGHRLIIGGADTLSLRDGLRTRLDALKAAGCSVS